MVEYPIEITVGAVFEKFGARTFVIRVGSVGLLQHIRSQIHVFYRKAVVIYKWLSRIFLSSRRILDCKLGVEKMLGKGSCSEVRRRIAVIVYVENVEISLTTLSLDPFRLSVHRSLGLSAVISWAQSTT